MAKTIEQIQQMITDKYDVREVINELTDYIQANPGGGGGGGGVQSVTGDLVTGTAEDPIVNLPNPLPAVDGSQLTNLPSGGWGTTGTVATLTGGANLQVAGNGFDIMDGVFHYLEIAPAVGLYFFGDVDTQANGTFLTIDDVNQKIILQITGNDCLVINAGDGVYFIGSNAAGLDIEEVFGVIDLGFSGGSNIRLDNNGGGFIDFTAGDLKINGSAGATGSFVAQSGETITVTKGIITAITPP